MDAKKVQETTSMSPARLGAPNGQDGLAAVEMALCVVALTAVLMLTLESFKAMNEYSLLEKAANEAARAVVRAGGSVTDATALTRSLTSGLGGSSPTVTITFTTDANKNNNVTVQVDHVYQPFTAPTQNTPVDFFSGKPLTISASTTMRLP